jgi:hypothetical protein
MDYWKNIAILIFTIGITILPMTGKIWSIKEKKIYWRGWLFIFFALCSLIIGFFQLRQDFNEQETRDNNQISVLRNTENILDNLNSSMVKIENKLLRIDKLNFKLDTLEHNTLSTIKRRDEILMDYNKLNTKLENLYLTEKIKIRENIPVVNVFEGVKWIKVKDDYKIYIVFTNTGERIAKQLFYNVWFFNTLPDGEIVNHKLLSSYLTQGDDLSPVKRTEYNLSLLFPNVPLLSPNDSIPVGYLWINYNYKDYVIDTTINKTVGYIWRGIKLDSLNWISMPTYIKEKIFNYSKSKGIKL